MLSSAQLKPAPALRARPTRTLKHRYARDLVEALAALFPAGSYPAVDLRGQPCQLEVFITRERRGRHNVVCGVRMLLLGSEFVLDDGADEVARTQLVGPPTFDANGNVGISGLVRMLDDPPRGASLWVAHDLSVVAVEDEVCFLK